MVVLDKGLLYSSMTSLELLRAVTTPFPNQVTFWGAGGQEFNRLLGETQFTNNKLPKKSLQTVGCHSYNITFSKWENCRDGEQIRGWKEVVGTGEQVGVSQKGILGDAWGDGNILYLDYIKVNVLVVIVP